MMKKITLSVSGETYNRLQYNIIIDQFSSLINTINKIKKIIDEIS